MSPSEISRVKRTKTQARESYNRLSHWYDWLAGSSEKPYRDQGLQMLAAQPGEHILEIGSGTGHCLQALALAVGPEGKVYGVDLSDGMLAIAGQRLQAAGLAPRVELRQGDGAHLYLPDETVDAVFMSFTLELFDTPEIPQVLAECWRVLKPGGRLALVTMVKPPRPGLAVKIYEWFHAKMPAMVDCRPIIAQATLVDAGFQVQQVITRVMWGLPVEIILSSRAPDAT